jgi:L-aminopeptidase/D-esterase-like protein
VSGPVGPGPVQPGPLNTTLVVVATDARLDPAETSRTATAAHDGLARALNPVHTLADGDTVFALATGAVALAEERTARVRALVDLQRVAADVVRDAVLDGIAAAEDVGPYPRYPGPGSPG